MFGETRKQPQGLADLLLWFGLVALCWLHGSTGDRIFSPRHMLRWPPSLDV